MKNEKTIPWTVYLPLDLREQPKLDIRDEIFNKIRMLEAKGILVGNTIEGLRNDDIDIGRKWLHQFKIK